MKDKPFISLDKQPGNQPPADKHRLNFLVSMAQVFKTILISVPGDTESRKQLLLISESLLAKIGNYTSTYINNFGRGEHEKAN